MRHIPRILALVALAAALLLAGGNHATTNDHIERVSNPPSCC